MRVVRWEFKRGDSPSSLFPPPFGKGGSLVSVIARSPDKAGRRGNPGGSAPNPPPRLLRLPPAAEWSRNDITSPLPIPDSGDIIAILTN